MAAIAGPGLCENERHLMTHKPRGSMTSVETRKAPRPGDAGEIRGSTPCKAILAINGFWRGLLLPASILRSFGAARWRLRVEAMLEGVLISLRGSRRRSAVHPTSPIRHRRGSARVSAPRSGAAARGQVHGQFVSHC
jgi:hypothetical protein